MLFRSGCVLGDIIVVEVFHVRYNPARVRVRGISFTEVGRHGWFRGAKVAQFRRVPVKVANRANVIIGLVNRESSSCVELVGR